MANHFPIGNDHGDLIIGSMEGMLAERVKQNALLGKLAQSSATSALFADMDEVAQTIRSGLGPQVLPVGASFVQEYADSRPNVSTTYDLRLDVMHHTTGTLEGGATIPVMYLQSHWCLPFETQVSNYQGFLHAIDGLPAGTYNVTMGLNWGSNVVSGKTYQFTLANALPAGGVLAGFRGAPDQNPSNWRVYAYSSNTATSETETATVSEGSSGTSLGTFTAAGAQPVPASGTPETSASVTIGGTTYRYYGLNSLHRVAYGNNRWLHSAIRQWLNATGTGWWVPNTVFDLPPAYVGNTGFLSGLPEDLVEAMRPVAQVTCRNYVTDGGTASSPEVDVTYDKVFLPSWQQHYLAPSDTFSGAAGLEGEAWDGWRQVANSASPFAAWTTHREYVQYDLADHTAARSCWMRSANRSSGNYVAVVYSSGTCSSSNALYGYRVAPACAIG